MSQLPSHPAPKIRKTPPMRAILIAAALLTGVAPGFCAGSDLKELCRAAAMVPVREVLRSREGRASVQKARENSKAGLPTDSNLGMSVRPLKNSDFFQVDTAVPLPRPEPDTLD